MKLLVASRRDVAAQTILQKLKEISGAISDTRILEIGGESVSLSALPEGVEGVIVLSRHASESGRPSLTTHVPGLLEEKQLAVASPPTLKAALAELARAKEELGLPHQVSLEATHHGPATLGAPVTFIEIGSTPEHWRDELAAEAAARAALAALFPPSCKRAIGVGGIHYSPLHTRVALETEVGIGHILPKYSSISESLIEQAIRRTTGRVDLIVVDRKGTTAEQRELCSRVGERLNIQVVRAGSLLKSS
jgi:D-aminoacyl-tRNA deacylase